MNVASLEPDRNEVLTSGGPATTTVAIRSRPAADDLYSWMQTLAVALVLILIAAILHIGEAAYIAFAFTGAFVTHVMFQPARRDLAASLLAGAGFGSIYYLHHGAVLDFFGSWFAIPGAFLGMGSLFVLAGQWIWAAPEERRTRLEYARDAALVPLLCVGSMLVVGPAIALTPETYDHVLYIFDAKFAMARLAGSPGWVVGRAFREHAWLYKICGYVYNSLPLGLAVCLALQWRDRLKKIWYPLDLRWLSMTLGGAGFLLYQVCPAAGPIYLFPKQFPFDAPALASILAAPALMQAVPRNGMPSLHFGWTLLLFWNMRRRTWWIALAAGAYVSLTALATLGLGEHYLVDLIVAVPVALALQGLWLRKRGTLRWIAIGTGTAITFAWLIAFRTGAALEIPAGAATWIAAGLTVVIPAVLAWRLERDVAQSPAM